MTKRIKFDGTFPDELPAEQSQWATYIPGRNPEFKVHSNLGLARSAMGQRSLDERYALYNLVEGTWVKTFEYGPRPNCDRCGQSYVTASNNRWRGSQRNWEDTGSRPWEGGNVICASCKNADDSLRQLKYQIKQERAEFERLKAKYETYKDN